MKKNVITLVLLALGFTAAYAQTPVKKTKSAIFDFSETWCPPCGGWGIDVIDTVEANMLKEGIGYVIGVKSTSTPTDMNALGGETMALNFEVDGVPSFIINNLSVNEGVTHDNPGDVARILKKVRKFDSTEAAGGIAALINITGNLVTVTVKSKFWNATSGEYYMSVMLVEDDLSAFQNNYANNPAIHTNILRGAMATSGTALSTDPWGESVGTTSITAGQEFTKIYKATVDPSWVVNKLAAYAVLFKKNTDGVYESVNVEKAAGNTSSVNEIPGLQNVSVYPNPATEIVNIAINASESLTVIARITDATGKLVYSEKGVTINKGANNLQIKTGQLPGGNYLITISDDKLGAISRNLVIQ